MALFNIFKCLLHLFICLVCAYMHVYMCACVYVCVQAWHTCISQLLDVVLPFHYVDSRDLNSGLQV